MSDEQMDRNLPRTSEPAPPEAEDDDSAEMVDQPPSPEESVASSTDCQPTEVPDQPAQPSVSSVPQQGSNEAEGFSLMRLLVANQPPPEDLRLQEVPRISSRRNEQAGLTGGEVVVHAEMVRAAFESAQVQEALEAMETSPGQAQALVVDAVCCEAATVEAKRAEPRWVESEPAEPRWVEATRVEAERAEAARVEAAIGGKRGFSREIAKGSIKRKIDKEKSEDSNQQSSESKSSENVDLGRNSSTTGSGDSVEETTGSGSSATEVSGLGSGSSKKISAVIEKKSKLGTGACKNVGLKSELYSSKTSTATPVSGAGATENVELEGILSPLKMDKARIVRSGSASATPEKKRDSLMPTKRKSPSKYQHSSPKRSAPFTTPDGLQKESVSDMSTLLEKLNIKQTEDKPRTSQPKRKSPSKYQHLSPKRSVSFTSPDILEKESDSHMSPLPEELDIEETEDRPGTSQSIFGHEQVQSMETGEDEESQREETEYFSDMREDEENFKKDDPEMDDSNYI